MLEPSPTRRLPLSVLAFGLLLLLGTVPALLVAEWTVLRHTAAVEDERLRATQTRAESLARLSADDLTERASMVGGIGRAIEQIEGDFDVGSSDELRSLLKGQGIAQDSIRRLILVDATGRPLAAAQTDALAPSTALAAASGSSRARLVDRSGCVLIDTAGSSDGAVWPELANQLAFITGAPRGSSVLRTVIQTGCPVLHKPVQRATLERCVQRLAAAPRPIPGVPRIAWLRASVG